ncbi:MAG: Protein of unknown function (DUF1049) [Phormidesmis priestleyi Ana]|uniref:Lipopolysaccharide assembly protein A domain-containing protein n=1 Tax=Phormidesmis priestleyi Ana TaxID=1666911 RepID=A0A0P8C3Y6_9CYAN|nr:MAG: Protein of unknown function (DUF1049) [Phormidesmis priestleyi Ana]
MVKLLVAIIPAILVVAIAILSVQNATLLSITFFRAETVALPVGIWLAFALGLGMAGTALLMSLFGGRKKRG